MRTGFISLLISLNLSVSCWASASMLFDNVNDEMSANSNSTTALDVTTGDVSWCSWVKTTEDAGTDWMGGKKADISTAAGYGIYQETTDVPICLASDGTTLQTASGTTDIDAGWHFLCCTWDGAGDDLTIYVDGVNEGSDTTDSIGSLTNSSAFQTGEDHADGNDANMVQAHLAVYARVLTTVEMEQIRWHPGSLGGAAAYWGMVEASGITTIPDWSGQGLPGTRQGSTGVSADGPPIYLMSPP